ncbi:df3345b0-6ff7-4c15-ba86-c3a612f118ad [Thermothielavioides terrestris]|uniref:ATP-dependent DNA helicase PIF1 n=1 Tax=Thermothielavioides terrestris TaxID=2587410 RepID=A0A3S4AP85_9PEZI|nr:df3345b0-6ff7-4c15-ba86-c3a612f118ad [Thermothielavioides terrestris]
MFGRAVEASKAAAADRPPARKPVSHAALKKQLFPSSSPSAQPAGSQGKSVVDLLTNKSLSRSVDGKAIASLCSSNSDSFREEPELVDLVDDSRRVPVNASFANNSASCSVYVCESDFSDDPDFDSPPISALPTLPQPQSQSVAKEHHEPPPTSPTSVLSWSQSSPSHYQQPPPQTEPPPRKTAKRVSPDGDKPAPTEAKRRRELPKTWSRRSAAQDDDAAAATAAATPAPKQNAALLWDTTASAVKAQKKQLKTQLKDSGKADASLEDMHEAVKSHAAKTSAITLSSEQRHVKSLVVDEGRSVFFTGPAGTGKSVLMRAIIQELKKKHARDPEKVAVTASTGLAACNIGGMTLHSFAGIGLGKEDVNTLVKKIRRNPKAKTRWLKTKVLIIDEISMVDGELFDKLSQIGRIIRNNGRPWGGIQLVITGDFFQLPPVPEGGKQRESKFAFDAATWSMSIDHTIGLTEVFRQRDPEFASMLNEMRLGRISDQTVRNFQALSRPLRFDDGLEVTELFPTRQEVDSSNQRRLQALTGKLYRYEAVDGGDPKVRDKLLANMMAPQAIELKKGAQVMLIKNMDETLVNGSLGTVVGFMDETTFELKGSADRFGEESDAKKRVRAFTNLLAEGAKADNKEYPMVRFHAVDGSQRTILCLPEDWRVELPTGEVQASRKQLPLILAWALSIHKAQGQTLERVKVDLGKVFEKGQAYVALSRATTQEGLQVLNFHKARVMAHPRVVDFYNKLYSAEAAVKKKAAGSIANYVVTQPAPQPAAGSARQPVTVVDDDEEEAMAAYG